MSVNGPEGVAVVLQCSAQRRDRTNQAPANRKAGDARRNVLASKNVTAVSNRSPGNSAQDVLRAVDRPVQRRPGRRINIWVFCDLT